jgi:hypothetical protein
VTRPGVKPFSRSGANASSQYELHPNSYIVSNS